MTNHRIPPDYDINPDRRRATVEASHRYLAVDDVHPAIAHRILHEDLSPVLDVGCGEGFLGVQLRERGIEFFGLDSSRTMLRGAFGPNLLGDATALPFPSNRFGAVAALYMLYHLDDALAAVAECRRVLRPGGLFVAATPSRFDMPELEPVFEPDRLGRASTFDAENGPDLVAEVFGDVEVHSWDGSYVRLPDAAAVREYARGFGASAGMAEKAPEIVGFPLSVTKRGAIIFARKK